MRKLDPVKHEEKRSEILEAARRCFARDGVQGASVSSICAEAGISPGHLYHYFESKEAILGAIVERVLEEAAARFDRTAASSDALAALLAEMEHSKAKKELGEHVIILDMFAEAARNPAMAEVVRAHTRGMAALVVRFLRKGQAQGSIDPSLDPEKAAAVLISVVDGAKVLAVREPSMNRSDTIELARTMIARFLAPPRIN